MACSTKYLKGTVLIYSGLFVVVALIALVFGAINLAIVLEYRRFLDSDVPGPGVILVVCLLLSCLLVGFSWRGTTQEKRCFLGIFGFLFALVALAQFGAAVWALVIRVNVVNEASGPMTESLTRYNMDEKTTSMWNVMQRELKCCGAGGPADFRSKGQLPWACCGSDSPHHGDCHYTFQRGCIQPVTDVVQLALLHMALIAFGVAVVQGAGVLCSCCLSNSIQNDKRRGREKA